MYEFVKATTKQITICVCLFLIVVFFYLVSSILFNLIFKGLSNA